jgi:hypothetical protein
VRSVHGTGPNDVWVGDDAALVHYDGTRLTPARSNTTLLGRVFATDHSIFLPRGPGALEELVRAWVTCL